jgi:disulfide bond formation protein DsbB
MMVAASVSSSMRAGFFGLPVTTLWVGAAALASVAMLAAAHAFERFGGYAPCALCLTAREIYWAALTIAGLGFVAAAALRNAWIGRLTAALLTLVFLVGVGIAVYHAGAEWKVWPGPAACAGALTGGGASGGDLLAELQKPIAVVPCDEAAWRMFGVSMAGYNAVISFGLMALSAWAAQQRR